MSAPSSTIRPDVGFSNPAIMRSVVVLPHPDGPSSEKNSPAAISSRRRSTAVTSPKVFVRSRMSMWPPAIPPHPASPSAGPSAPAAGASAICSRRDTAR